MTILQIRNVNLLVMSDFKMQDFSTMDFVYLIKLQLTLNIKSFFIKMHKELHQHLDNGQIIHSTFYLVYQNLIRIEKRLNFQCNCRDSDIVKYLFNFLIAVQEDQLLNHRYFKNKPICQFIINKFGTERFMGLDMKSFNDAKYITNPALLKFVKNYISVVIKFQVPFNPIGIQEFWSKFGKGFKGEDCCEDISKFIKKFDLRAVRLKVSKQRRSKSMTLLYVLYLWHSFKSFYPR